MAVTLFFAVLAPLLWDIRSSLLIPTVNRDEEQELSLPTTLASQHDSSSNSIKNKHQHHNLSHITSSSNHHPVDQTTLTLFCKEQVDWNTENINISRSTNAAVEPEHARLMLEPNPLGRIGSLLGQTICHEKGSFQHQSSNNYWNASDPQQVYDWELKLLYLAIQDFHHAPARKEHLQRKQQCGEDVVESLPAYDYPCQDAKYIVTALPNIGLGASIRLSAVAHVVMGIASDRIPLFVMNSPEGPMFLQEAYKLASCDRQDFQCVFLPTTPCTVSWTELSNATILDELAARGLKRGGHLDPKYDHDRVVLHRSRIAPAKFDQFKGLHSVIRQKLFDKAMELVEEWNKASIDDSSKDPEQYQVFLAAANRIGSRDLPDTQDHYTYGHR
jgi:hypothetical protein